MIRTAIWLLGGLLLGGVIHIVTILALPSLAEDTSWTRIEDYEASNRILILPAVVPGAANPLRLDPDLSYGICRVDLDEGPAYLSGVLPDAFWSVAIYDRSGIVTYSTTNRDGIGQNVDIGIFNADQTRLLAQQQIDIAEGLLVVEAQSDDLLIVVRLSPPHEIMRPRFDAALSQITCGPRAS
ncbi:DUF1254 domain-containing protein [Devosia chinhatensis]|uniref:DUF1254 domain-containing protein n=1 Tax=Devosia chinhatensis TaxID=429727 RepID=A0A0F5FLF7_9HYPH|nr:hypothetical protein [Devosia chinhatensis]KKB09027.1 hypothetical protein VE26_03050 [Devosia chinhatensis]